MPRNRKLDFRHSTNTRQSWKCSHLSSSIGSWNHSLWRREFCTNVESLYLLERDRLSWSITLRSVPSQVRPLVRELLSGRSIITFFSFLPHSYVRSLYVTQRFHFFTINFNVLITHTEIIPRNPIPRFLFFVDSVIYRVLLKGTAKLWRNIPYT